MQIPKTKNSPQTQNFAHRGFTASAPENSLAAFQAAIELGVDGIEFDVRVCASGEVVAFHDPGLSRMTGATGLVKGLPLEQLQKFRFLHNGGNTDEFIPTLEQVLELVDGKLKLNVEIKTDGLPPGHNIEKKVIAALKQFGVFDTTIISSFNPIVMRRLHKVDPEAIAGLLIDKTFNIGNTGLFFARILKAKAVHMNAQLLTKSLFEKIQSMAMHCLVWTVNQADMMEKFLDWGVTGIITDQPDALLNITRDNAHD